jgi:hypothetical protein
MKTTYYLFYTILIIIVLLAINEFYHFIKLQHNRLKIFDLAERRAKLLNKPLIVIGDPYNGHSSRFYTKFYKTYGCGDETVDLTGSPRCPNGIKSDAYEHLKTKQSNSAVIFISCVLEYVDNIDNTIKELYRVSGTKNNLFVVCVNNKSLAAYMYRDKTDISKNLVYVDKYNNINYKKL